MDTVAGFEITETLVEGRTDTLHRARREGTSYLVRTPGHHDPTAEELARVRYGHEINRTLDHRGVLRELSLETVRDGYVLAMEDPGGLPLSVLLARAAERGGLPVLDALTIALQLAQALGALHGAHVVHKGIEPGNILVHPDTLDTRLTHFDVASRLSRENPLAAPVDRLEASLTYISPELTGRMNRAVDYRTDFYSLGVTLYEMVTGVPPFQAASPMALVHSHIAVEPEPPYTVRRTVPRAVSDLVLKLLAKNAEDRYQSAFGLAEDLREVTRQLKSSGTITEFVTGTRDTPAHFQIPQKLYGREAEKTLLLSAFDRVATGATELVLVSGYSGIGKSALVSEIHKPLVGRRGYFTSGKYDQLQNVPYAGLIQAFRQLILQVLSESEDRIAVWRDRLREALGASGQLVIDVIPEVALIIGPQPSVPPQGPTESQHRFNMVFQGFSAVFATAEHPLAIFLDDLQWADAGSLNLLPQLLKAGTSHHLLIIGAYRDNEVLVGHPLLKAVDEARKGPARISEVSLRPLERLHVERLTRDTLGGDPESLSQLAALVFEKTQGNPFFVNQFLASLHTRGLLAFDPALGRWTWDVNHIRHEGITDNVAVLMAEKIRTLPEGAQQAMRLAACIGAVFDLSTLARLADRTEIQTAADLWTGVEAGLVVPVGEGYKFALDGTASAPVLYRFLHDRVQEAAYGGIPEDQRTAVHLTLGRQLRDRVSPEDRDARIFDIVNQLDLAMDLVTDPDERMDLARLNLIAGKRAKESTAYASAERYLRAGCDLVGDNGWTAAYDLTFALFRSRAEVDYLLARFDEANARFDTLVRDARTLTEKREVYSLKINLLQSTGDYVETWRLGRELMTLLGIDLPDNDDLGAAFGTELGLLQKNMAGREILSLADLPAMTDPDDLTRAAVMGEMILFGAYNNPSLFAYLSARLVNYALSHGNAPGSSIGYVCFAMLQGAAFGDYKSAYDYGRVGLSVAEKYDEVGTRAIAIFFFSTFTSPFRRPLDETFPYLDQTYAGSQQAGSLVYVGLASMQAVLLRLIHGEELHGLYDLCRKTLDFQQRMNQWDLVYFLGSFQRAMLMLTRGSLPEDRPAWHRYEVINEKLAKLPPWILVSHVFEVQVAYLFGDLPLAMSLLKTSLPHIASAFGFIGEPEFRFFHTLTLCAVYPEGTAEERTAWDAALAENVAKMKTWADNCTENFLHKHLLLSAEVARIAGNDSATDLYDQAIDAAAACRGYVQHHALANELAGRFHLARGRRRVARGYLTEARHLYVRWGADAKVADLEKRYEDILPRGGERGAGATIASLDLATVIKATQAISREIVLGELLRTLMATMLENAGAQRGMLVLRGDSPQVVVLDRTHPTDESLTDSTHEVAAPVVEPGSVEGRADVSSGIVRYVERTLERVVLGDAASVGQFQSDPYIARVRPRSVLCMPVMQQGKLVGTLYLENNLVANAFTPARCEVLDLLAAQAAISLVNARLYETLDQRVRDRTQELRASNDELSHTVQRLRDTQKQLIMQEKLASLGALTSGIAHEIKNPLNFINNFAQLSVDLADELVTEVDTLGAVLDGKSRDYLTEVVGDLKQNATKIYEHGRRADTIVKAMLDHARSGSGEKREVDVNNLLQEYVNLAYQGLRSQDAAFNVTLESDYAPEVPTVTAVPQDLGRVFLNLVNNACYAVEARRKASGPSYKPTVRVSTRVLDHGVEIRVRDNGVGIPPALREKIFNPFFTTKPPGEGTGLGLSISYDIVVQGYGGTMSVASAEGEFAEFSVVLPGT